VNSNQVCGAARDGTVNLTVSPATIAAGGAVTVSWSGISAPSSGDWIGLYIPGAGDENFISWMYVSCSTSSGSARSSGSCSFALPGTLSGGNYELRLLANNGYTRLATANPFTVMNGVGVPPPSAGPVEASLTLSVTPSVSSAGGAATVSWSGISAPSSRDWIGLYIPGAGDENFISWMYVSCSTSSGSARSSGSCSFALPGTLSGGNYELRLLANDGYTRLATSSILSILTSANAAVSRLSVTTSNESAGANPSLGYSSTQWFDYEFSVSLKSTSSGSMGVMFRYQDDKNYYRFLWDGNSKIRHLEKVQNGIASVLAGDGVPYISGRTYQLKVRVEGISLKILIDGFVIFSVTDSTFGGGTVGLYSSANPGTIFDDVLVKELTAGVALLSDNFDQGRFSGWTIVDRGLKPGASVWAVINGTLTQGSASDTFVIYTLRSNWRDYSLELNVKSIDLGSIGVMFRYQDNANYYRFSWNSQTNVRRLEKSQDGIFTVLAEDLRSYTAGRSYNLAVRAKGSGLEVLLDGTQILTAMDATFSAGTIALYSSSNHESSFDNIFVEDLTTGAVLLTQDFNAGSATGWTIVDNSSAAVWLAQNGAFVQIGNGDLNLVNAATYALY